MAIASPAFFIGDCTSCFFICAFVDSQSQHWCVLVAAYGPVQRRTVAQVALRWLLQRRSVASGIDPTNNFSFCCRQCHSFAGIVVIGVRTLEQLEENMQCVGWELHLELIKRLDIASNVPAPCKRLAIADLIAILIRVLVVRSVLVNISNARHPSARFTRHWLCHQASGTRRNIVLLFVLLVFWLFVRLTATENSPFASEWSCEECKHGSCPAIPLKLFIVWLVREHNRA